MRYTVIVERGDKSWGVHVPDLPGCVAVANSRAEALDLIKEAIEFHLESLERHGESPPEPRTEVETIVVGAV